MENLATLPSDINIHWQAISPLLTIRNDKEYERAIQRLNTLIDRIGTNEQHPLYNLLDTLGQLIEIYEQKHYSIPNCSGSDALAYLIEEHDLSLSDLPEIGTPEIVKAILNKERAFSITQIKLLSQRFNIQAQVFLD